MGIGRNTVPAGGVRDGDRRSIAITLAVGYGAALIVAWLVGSIADTPPVVTCLAVVLTLLVVASTTGRFSLVVTTGAVTKGRRDFVVLACGISIAVVSWLVETDPDGWFVPAIFGVLPAFLVIVWLAMSSVPDVDATVSWRRELLLSGATAGVAVALVMAGTGTPRPGVTGLSESVAGTLLFTGAWLIVSAAERAWAGLQLWEKRRYLPTP